MKTLEYVIEHYEEFEEDTFFDKRWTKRFLDFLPVEQWEVCFVESLALVAIWLK